ncbi:MAG: type II toxin-antitoxin system prevent-host-death family antitoxin [Patescibacteria group bacterium]
MKNNIVGLKELRENLDTYISQVDKGKSFIIVRKSKPLFKISSVDEDEGLWETIIDFTKINKNGIDAKQVLKVLRKLNASS